MKNRLNILLFLLILFSGCSDFLEEKSQDLTYARTYVDLDEILVGDGYMKIPGNPSELIGLGNMSGPYFPWLHVMDDDIQEKFQYAEANQAKMFGFYLWEEYPHQYEGSIVEDAEWKRLYKHISVVNAVLAKTKDIQDYPEEIERIQGECYFLRAVNYYFLVNIYAKPYAKATADTDLGVPVKNTEYIEDVYFKRQTVREVYDQIVSDLLAATRLLKGKQRKTVYRTNYYAAQAFLSRIYLYMEEYEKVLPAVDTVMQGGYEILEFNGITPGTSVTTSHSPETIFTQGSNSCTVSNSGGIISSYRFIPSEDLRNMYTMLPGTDLRRSLFFIQTQSWNPSFYALGKLNDKRDGQVSAKGLIRLPEVLLNQAEALAILGRDDEALAVLEKLRVKRISASDYTPLSRKSGEELVQLVRDERRRELCFEGHRWFDLRRYAVNSKYPFSKEIIHDHYFYNSATWSPEYMGSVKLKKYDEEPAYVIPIPRQVILFNQGNIEDNAPRPKREMFNRFVDNE